MTASNGPEDSSTPLPLKVGYGLTALWIGSIVAYLIWCWPEVRKLEPNALGDFMSGAAAPMAFLWLVIAVFLQKDELSLQRQELTATKVALERQAYETGELVKRNTSAVQTAQEALALQKRKEMEAAIGALLSILAKEVCDGYASTQYSVNGKLRFLYNSSKDPSDLDRVFRGMRRGTRTWSKDKLEARLTPEHARSLVRVCKISDMLEDILGQLAHDHYYELNARARFWGLIGIAQRTKDYIGWMKENGADA